ncbi:hypothetical protein [Sphingosinicella sp. BN140058]|uniref:hypothetical protein n=1 Tax=Sphingosinicella sp. BN140058 TaxID=1892855 RepID=UPI0010121B9A|nr:hypothetical protein [Sphingosinicella sp. BN140058]QAY78926.1 hypothetical protein ETR14_22085 [Sphingosinicella sp. BN140058]
MTLLAASEGMATASRNSCVRVIQAWHEAIDCQVTEQVESLTWSNGFSNPKRLPWSEVRLNGACPKYVSELRDWRVSPERNRRQVVRVRVRSWHVDADGRATGLAMTERPKYTCERRSGQWRIFSKE